MVQYANHQFSVHAQYSGNTHAHTSLYFYLCEDFDAEFTTQTLNPTLNLT